jgi:hypothetical protein
MHYAPLALKRFFKKPYVSISKRRAKQDHVLMRRFSATG